MSKVIRFLGGPADEELRAVPEEVVRLEFFSLVEQTEVPPDHLVKYEFHEYRETFPGSVFFKYQGKTIREKEMPLFTPPRLMGMRWFRE